MGIRFRHASFGPARSPTRVKSEGELDALITLTDGVRNRWFGIRFALPTASPGGIAASTAQSIQAWCEARHIPCLLRSARGGRSKLPKLQLCIGGDAALAERFGAAVREYLEADRSRYGITVALRPAARTPVLDRLTRRHLKPLPKTAPAAWACAVQLLDGISAEGAGSGSITEWTL